MRGAPARASFRAELICLVDTLDGGVRVQRPLARMHAAPLWYWAKRCFEWQYLRADCR